MTMAQFLKSLIKVSVKAANIARVCREEKHLFQLLVQEKHEGDKNPRFFQDFKTLADVLIQETIKHDIGIEFPNIASHIKGEESNSFSNVLGESITVAIQENEADTAALLTQVLNGDTRAGGLLAAEVHKAVLVDYQSLNVDRIPDDLTLPVDNFGIWIDPIDSTFEYISGSEEPSVVRNIHSKGLQCVTVLIGVFNRQTGEPVVGVVNQPFITKKGSEWFGKCYWGINYEDKHYFSDEFEDTVEQQKVVVLSSSESSDLKERLTERGYLVVEAAGAGYKCLVVALGQADAYLLSRGTTYRWDICGPHALLLAQNGGIIRFVPAEQGSIQEISYLETDDDKSEGINQWCNKDGVIAYRNAQFLGEIVHLLKKS
ncbi:hypothetical protein R5R35_004555 [Gryllus longicercus]|uniref:inositol-1,4-bisphosphate 1-phosphatase n=1 Tax=Gryllus longicercus TaxID=2509291 RepID=A0AAN9ZFR4_9ORTH